MTERNPYIVQKKQPQLRPSVFVFMDILGYREMIAESHKKGTEQQLLTKLHKALSKARISLEHDPDERKLLKKDLYALKAFTDNIVIGWPIHGDAEIELGDAFSIVGEFQFKMILEGFFIRGAISVGNTYIDDIAVFGNALTQAYKGESELARDPRIILTQSSIKAVNHHLDYYGRERHAPQVRDLLKDSDGQWFVNYLDIIMIAEEDYGPNYNDLLKHKKAVEKKLKEYKNNPPIFSKYAWVAGYHNYFCGLHKRHFSAKHMIDTDLFRAPPSLIVD